MTARRSRTRSRWRGPPYVLHRDMSNVGDVVTQLLETDPEEESRQAMREYYLGDFPRDGYLDSFLTEARRYI